LREHPNNFFDVVDKSHIQHPIRLVERKKSQLVEMHNALPHQIKQPSWRRDQNINSRLNFAYLRVLFDPAKNNSVSHPRPRAVRRKTLINLDRELAGGGDDQCFDPTRPFSRFSLLVQQLKHRNRERSGFAGAGLRTPE